MGILKAVNKHTGQGESVILTKATLSHVFDILIGLNINSGASNIQVLQLSGFCGRGCFKLFLTYLHIILHSRSRQSLSITKSIFNFFELKV